MRRCHQIDDEPCRHTEPGGCESVVPAKLFAERAAYKWREKRAKIDADVKYRKCTIAATITRRVKRADLCRDIGLEGSVAKNEKPECAQKKLLEGHRKMSRSHQRGANDDSSTLTKYSVGEETAQDGRQINQAGIKAIDVRGERLRG